LRKRVVWRDLDAGQFLDIYFCRIFLPFPARSGSDCHGNNIWERQGFEWRLVPGASIILTNESTGVTRKAVTSGTGDYVVAQLPPGTYSVTASHPGFQAKTVSGVVLTVTARTPVDFALSLGAVTQQVTVKASVTQLETGSSSLGQIIR